MASAGVRRAGRALLLAVLCAGCAQVGQHQPGTPAHHRVAGFANETGVTGEAPLPFLLDRLRLAFADDTAGVAPALTGDEARAAWAASGEADAVQWLGHGTVRLRLAGTVVLLDPVFGAELTPIPPLGPPRLSAPPVTPADLADVAAILLTHDHYDHFEPDTVNAVAAAGAACLVPLGLDDGEGLDCATRALDWGDSVRLGGVTATLLPSQHESGRGLFDRDRSLWGSWMLEAGGRRVYLAGDSGYGPHFTSIGRGGPGIDLVVFNLGGYEPSGSDAGMHMAPPQVVRAFLDLGARRALMVHWGTYPLGGEDPGEMRAMLARVAASQGIAPDRIVFLAIGGVLRL